MAPTATSKIPMLAEELSWLVMGYSLMLFNLIFDFLPIIGQLNEMVIIPFLFFLSLKLAPQAIFKDCRDYIHE